MQPRRQSVQEVTQKTGATAKSILGNFRRVFQSRHRYAVPVPLMSDQKSQAIYWLTREEFRSLQQWIQEEGAEPAFIAPLKKELDVAVAEKADLESKAKTEDLEIRINKLARNEKALQEKIQAWSSVIEKFKELDQDSYKSHAFSLEEALHIESFLKSKTGSEDPDYIAYKRAEEEVSSISDDLKAAKRILEDSDPEDRPTAEQDYNNLKAKLNEIENRVLPIIRRYEEKLRATQREPLVHPDTADRRVVIYQNPIVDSAHRAAIITLTGEIPTLLYDAEKSEDARREMNAAVFDQQASNLTRMQYFYQNALRGLRQTFHINDSAEILIPNSMNFTENLDQGKLSLVINAFYEAAYFGASDAIRWLLILNSKGWISLTDSEVCDLVEAQLEWCQLADSAERPRDDNGLHLERYSYSEALSTARAYPDLTSSDKAWKPVIQNKRLLQNLLSKVYFKDSLRLQSLIVANENASGDARLSNEDLRRIVGVRIELYKAAHRVGSEIENDESQTIPEFFPVERYKRLWEALEEAPKLSYELLQNFFQCLNRRQFSLPVLAASIEEARSDIEREQGYQEDAKIEAAISAKTMANRAINEPEKFVGYFEHAHHEEKQNALSPNQYIFAQARVGVLKAMARLRHATFSRKLRDPFFADQRENYAKLSLNALEFTEDAVKKFGGLYDVREVINSRKNTNTEADELAKKTLFKSQKALSQPAKEFAIEVATLIKHIEKENQEDMSTSSRIPYSDNIKQARTGGRDAAVINKDRDEAIVERDAAKADYEGAVKNENEAAHKKQRRPSIFGATYSDLRVKAKQKLEEAEAALIKYQARVDQLERQIAEYEQRKAQRDAKLGLIHQLKTDVDKLLADAEKIQADEKMKYSQRSVQLDTLKAEGERIDTLVRDDLDFLPISTFLKKVTEFIALQIHEADAQAARKECLKALKDREDEINQEVIKTNPLSEVIFLALLADSHDMFVYHHPTENWLQFIAECLDEDFAVFLRGDYAFDRVGSIIKKGREALPLTILKNDEGYIALLQCGLEYSGHTVTFSKEQFLSRVSSDLFHEDGFVRKMLDRQKVELLTAHGLEVTTSRSKEKLMSKLNKALSYYAIDDNQDRLLDILNANFLVKLRLSVDVIFPETSASASPEKILKDAQVTCDRLRKIVNSADAPSRLVNYIKIAMIVLGDFSVLNDLLLKDENNPVKAICLDQGIEFTFSDDVRFVIEKTLLRDMDINGSTIGARRDVLQYLASLFANRNTGLDFLLECFARYILAEENASREQKEEHAAWRKKVKEVYEMPRNSKPEELTTSSLSAEVGDALNKASDSLVDDNAQQADSQISANSVAPVTKVVEAPVPSRPSDMPPVADVDQSLAQEKAASVGQSTDTNVGAVPPPPQKPKAPPPPPQKPKAPPPPPPLPKSQPVAVADVVSKLSVEESVNETLNEFVQKALKMRSMGMSQDAIQHFCQKNGLDYNRLDEKGYNPPPSTVVSTQPAPLPPVSKPMSSFASVSSSSTLSSPSSNRAGLMVAIQGGVNLRTVTPLEKEAQKHKNNDRIPEPTGGLADMIGKEMDKRRASIFNIADQADSDSDQEGWDPSDDETNTHADSPSFRP